MNPAALKTNIKDLPKGGTLIVNADAFNERNLQKAGYAANPLEDGSLDEYQVHSVPLTTMTVGALKDIEGVTSREAERSKNMFALGLMSWLYGRPIDATIVVPRARSSRSGRRSPRRTSRRCRPATRSARRPRRSPSRTRSSRRSSRPASYRNITGNQALSYGLIAASKLSGLPLFLGAYPITPASSILEELAGYKNFGVRTFQAEDEIAAAGAALGASFGGALGVTTSAGPGIVLKAETIGLAMQLELPLVICDIQRAGPSTGMPTKPEQGDLLMVLFGRNSRVAGAGRRCDVAVGLLPRRDRGVPHRAQVPHARLPALRRVSRERLGAVAPAGRRDAARHLDRRSRPSRTSRDEFLPYLRDEQTLARPWAVPGTPGLEHRDRRAREGGPHRATSRTTPTTTT